MREPSFAAAVFRLVNADRDGHALTEHGLAVRLDTPLTSRLVLCPEESS